MTTTSLTAQQQLQTELETVLDDDRLAARIVNLVIGAGWQPRPLPDPNSDYLDGVLDDGRHVPIQIRHAFSNQRA